MFAISRPGTLVLGDTGSGKSLISMALIETLKPQLTIIVAPLTSLDITWAPKLDTLMFYVARSWEDFQAHRHSAHVILLIHFQLLAKLGQKLERVPWDLAIIDESQSIKDRASATSRAARRLRHAHRRIALSATPIDKSPIDLYGQMRFIDVSVFGDNFTTFALKWCMLGGYKGKKWIFQQRLLPQYLDTLKEHVYRLPKSFLKLPPLRVRTVPVLMLGAQRRIYDQMYAHGIVQLNGNITIPAPYPVTRQGKLEQITGGTLLNGDGSVHIIGHAKARKLAALAGRLAPPVVIFCKFLAEIPLIRAALPWPRIEELHGGVIDGRTDLINDFQAGHIDALICQMRTGGTSISLTAAATLIFYSQNFSLIDFEQVLGRFHRPGQTRPVDVHVLYAVNSRDEEIIAEIEQKHATFYEVIDFFRERP